MAITSIGYPNTIAPGSATALWHAAAGRPYVFPAESQVKPNNPQAGTRRVTLSPGRFSGKGITDYNDALVNLDLPTPAGSSQWFAIVANRWVDPASTPATPIPSGDTTSFGWVAGTATKAIPAVTQNPGTFDQQLIALALVESGQQFIRELVDLRAIGEEGGVYTIFDEMALHTIKRPGARAYNPLTSMSYECVYAPNRSLEWRAAWTPNGERPHLMMYRDSPFSSPIATGSINLYGGLKNAQRGDAAAFLGYSYGTNQQGQAATNPSKLVIKQDGVYAVAGRLEITPSVNAHFGFALNEYAPAGAPTVIAAPYSRQYVHGGQSTEFFLGESRFFHAGTEIRPTMGQNGSTFLVERWYLWATRLS